jgi:tetratricopeptide (TPR) repeat protein
MPLTISTQQREALKEKGRDLYSRKLYRDALELFNKAAQGPPSASVLDNRAATHEKLGDLDAALQDAMSIIKLQKDLDRGYLRCGSVLHKMGKLDKALAVYDKGLERCGSTSLSLVVSCRRLHTRVFLQHALANGSNSRSGKLETMSR